MVLRFSVDEVHFKENITIIVIYNEARVNSGSNYYSHTIKAIIGTAQSSLPRQVNNINLANKIPWIYFILGKLDTPVLVNAQIVRLQLIQYLLIIDFTNLIMNQLDCYFLKYGGKLK